MFGNERCVLFFKCTDVKSVFLSHSQFRNTLEINLCMKPQESQCSQK